MKPGIYQDVSNDSYHSGPGVSSSGIKKLLDCPKKFEFEYILGNRFQPTPAMIFGTNFHTMVLENDKFQRLVVKNDFGRGTKKFKDFKEEQQDGAIIVNTDELEKLYDMHDAVMAHPVARGILESEGEPEQSYYWIDEATGELCKIRPDKPAEYNGYRILADLKTAVSARPEAYEKVIYNLGYHISAAMYLEGAYENQDPRQSFVHIVVEKEAPHVVEVYNIRQETLEAGNDKFRAGLERLKEYRASGVWPGYTDGLIHDIGIPYWADQ